MGHRDRVRTVSAPPLVVVGAAIIDGDGRLLSARRSSPPLVAGRWELPGGKVEAGETEIEALLRECREELGVLVEVDSRVGADWSIGPGRVLRVWTARVLSGTPQPLEDHDELRWLDAGRWFDVEWLPADLPVIEALRATVGR
jgi:8-oxo-dGTP diphosphatase